MFHLAAKDFRSSCQLPAKQYKQPASHTQSTKCCPLCKKLAAIPITISAIADSYQTGTCSTSLDPERSLDLKIITLVSSSQMKQLLKEDNAQRSVRCINMKKSLYFRTLYYRHPEPLTLDSGARHQHDPSFSS